MNKSKILVYSIIVISIILCIPSVLYLVNNKTVDGFDAYYTYTLVKSDSEAVRLISGFVVIGLFLAFSVLYFFIVKKSQQIFTCCDLKLFPIFKLFSFFVNKVG